MSCLFSDVFPKTLVPTVEGAGEPNNCLAGSSGSRPKPVKGLGVGASCWESIFWAPNPPKGVLRASSAFFGSSFGGPHEKVGGFSSALDVDGWAGGPNPENVGGLAGVAEELNRLPDAVEVVVWDPNKPGLVADGSGLGVGLGAPNKLLEASGSGDGVGLNNGSEGFENNGFPVDDGAGDGAPKENVG